MIILVIESYKVDCFLSLIVFFILMAILGILGFVFEGGVNLVFLCVDGVCLVINNILWKDKFCCIILGFSIVF